MTEVWDVLEALQEEFEFLKLYGSEGRVGGDVVFDLSSYRGNWDVRTLHLKGWKWDISTDELFLVLRELIVEYLEEMV